MSRQGQARFEDLPLRLASGVGLAAAGLALLWAGGHGTGVLLAAGAGVAAWEWRSITAERGGGPGIGGAIAAGTAAAAVFAFVDFGAAAFAVLAAGAALLTGADLRAGCRALALWSLLGLTLIGVSAIALLALRLTEPYGFETAFWVVLVVVAADTGGYFAGRLFGGPKLWPAVSPKKTWAGLAGGVGLAFFGGGLFSWATTGTYFYEVCTVSAVAALLAQGGDLAQSALKRRFGVKDAGRVIPGHGGALDRFDGLMAASLVAAAVTFWRGQAVFIW
ncbi:MAG: phosphatidate cytidylyltransferase [Pikeienuella sp.]